MKKVTWIAGLGLIAIVVIIAGALYYFRESLFPGLAGPDSAIQIPFLSNEKEDSSSSMLPAVVSEPGTGTQPPGTAPRAAEKVAGPTADEWAAMPGCTVDPLTPTEWDQFFTRAGAAETTEALTMQRAAQLAPEAQIVEQPNSAAPQAQRSAPASDFYTALLMNVASGRLNRATEISLTGFPEIKTVGDLLDRMESTASAAPALAAEPAQGGVIALEEASRQVMEGKGIVRPVCARLFVTQVGNLIDDVQWSSTGMSERAVQAAAVTQSYKVIGEGIASPNGEWAAFRSGGQDTGGPVFLLNLQTNEWKDVVEAMRSTTADPASLPESYSWWDVIGWLPGSDRLVIGPADLPWVYVVDINTFSYQSIALQTFGLGGSQIVHLSPDGSKLVYIGNDATGTQQLTTVDLAAGQSAVLFSLTFSEGVLQHPRFSPDGKAVAYVVQKGNPQTGLTYAINIFSIENGTSKTLIEGNLGATRPVWSPDGQHIAFTRKSTDEADVVSPDSAPEDPTGNIWVTAQEDGKTWQVTFVNGLAAQPSWANDSKTLSFITGQGQVGLVDIQQPGKAWKAADVDPAMPLFTSTFFLP